MERFREDNIGRAVAAILFSVLALSFGDAVIKSFSVAFSIWQLFVIRSIFAGAFLIALLKLRRPQVSLLPVAVRWTALRSFLLALSLASFYSALPHVHLAVAATLYYTIPLFIALFSALFTRDPVGAKSWFAITLGFAGIVVIVRPEAGEFNVYALVPMAAAVFYALAAVLTRTKCRHEKPLVLALSVNAAFIAVGAAASLLILVFNPLASMPSGDAFLLGGWAPLAAKEWLVMGVLAAAVTIGWIFAAVAYQSGPSPVVAAFDYSYIIFSALWGLVFFAEIPGLSTLAGMAMIVGGGVLITRR